MFVNVILKINYDGGLIWRLAPFPDLLIIYEGQKQSDLCCLITVKFMLSYGSVFAFGSQSPFTMTVSLPQCSFSWRMKEGERHSLIRQT